MTDEAYWDGLSTRSLARFFLLASLNEGPKHGYEIKRSIAENCAGCCDPTDAMIYPTPSRNFSQAATLSALKNPPADGCERSAS